MAAIEALACGLPVVTSNASKNAIKDLVNDTTGIISEVNAEAFAVAILACLKRRDLMTGNCMKAAQIYDWERIVQEIEEYYVAISGISSSSRSPGIFHS